MAALSLVEPEPGLGFGWNSGLEDGQAEEPLLETLEVQNDQWKADEPPFG